MAMENEDAGGSGSWWGSWVNAAKVKSAEVYEFVKNDLNELSSAVKNEASAVLSSTSNAVKETLQLDKPESTANNVKRSVSSFFDQVGSALSPPPEDGDEEAIIIQGSDPVFLNRLQTRLYTLASEPRTFTEDIPAEQYTQFESWLGVLEEDKMGTDKLTKMLASSPALQENYTTLVPQHKIEECRSKKSSERQQPIDLMKNEMMASQVRPFTSLLTNVASTSEYHLGFPGNMIHQSEPSMDKMCEKYLGWTIPPLCQPNIVSSSFNKVGLREHKRERQQLLKVESKPTFTPIYNPIVEPISPPQLAETNIFESIGFRPSKEKEKLLQQISKIDWEIGKIEKTIVQLKNKYQELEEAAEDPDKKNEEDEKGLQLKHQSLAHKIYSENRAKALKSHASLEKIGPKVELPLYNQPSDTAVYHENKRRHILFRKRLLLFLQRKKKEREAQENDFAQNYSLLMGEWTQKVNKIEKSAKAKANDTKRREVFEKMFPVLRKQRDSNERVNRVRARSKSEIEREEIMNGAVFPPPLLDVSQRRHCYINNNGRIEDFSAEFKERQISNKWTESEIKIFKEKFLQFPKMFSVIASYLNRKNTADCVRYYYLTKKEENYKNLLIKSRHRERPSRNAQNKVNNNIQEVSPSTDGTSNYTIDTILAVRTV